MHDSKQNSIVNIGDHTARQIVDMAKKFFSDEVNIKNFEQWHLKTYGCLPDKSIIKSGIGGGREMEEYFFRGIILLLIGFLIGSGVLLDK